MLLAAGSLMDRMLDGNPGWLIYKCMSLLRRNTCVHLLVHPWPFFGRHDGCLGYFWLRLAMLMHPRPLEDTAAPCRWLF